MPSDEANAIRVREQEISKTLSMQVAPDLLQGVPLSLCLSGWGKHWTMRGQAPVGKSRRVDGYQNFFRHDWGTSRWFLLVQ